MRTKLEIKRIDLWSLFRIAFFMYATIGLVFGFLYGFLLLIAGLVENALVDEGLPELGILGGVLGIILIPLIAVFYGAIGSVGVTIAGFLYNLYAKFLGGVRLETKVDVTPEPPPAGSAEPVDSPPAI